MSSSARPSVHSSFLGSRRGCRFGTFLLVGPESDFIHADLSHLVDHVNNCFVTYINTTLDIDNLPVRFILQWFQEGLNLIAKPLIGIFILISRSINQNFLLPKIILAVIRNGYDNRVLLDDVLIDIRIVHV